VHHYLLDEYREIDVHSFIGAIQRTCPGEHALPSTKIEFHNREGITLAARFDQPEGAVRAYALFAHCFTCSKDSLAASRIAKGLMERGIGVLRFDFTGLGESGGAFDSTSFASNMHDLQDAGGWLREHHDAPQLLIGHSLGGAAVLAVAPSLSEIRGVATIGAPADPAHVRHLFANKEEEIQREGSAEVTLGGRPFRIGKAFVDDLEAQDPRRSIGDLGLPLMIFHSPIDQIVGIENAAQIYAWAKHPKSFVSLDRADHLLTNRFDADYVAGMIAAWSQRVVEA
jgi:putative redox protein